MSEKPKHSSNQGISSHGTPLSNRSGSGFTLVELLVVIAIVAVLALVSFAVSGRVMDGARGTTAVTNLRQLSLANISYATENGGRIVGPGNGLDWKGQSTRGMGVMGRLFPYVSGEDKLPSWDDLHRVYVRYRDPNVPTAISNPPTPGTYQITWANNLYLGQYPGGGSGESMNAGKRMAQIDRPERVIYMISGRGDIKPEMGKDSSMVKLPSAPRLGIYYSTRGKAPAAFLDGHGELLSFPIDPLKFNPGN